jgi:hypothetical protein
MVRVSRRHEKYRMRLSQIHNSYLVIVLYHDWAAEYRNTSLLSKLRIMSPTLDCPISLGEKASGNAKNYTGSLRKPTER